MAKSDDRAFLNQLPDYTAGSKSLLDKNGSGALDSRYLNIVSSCATQLYNRIGEVYSSGQHVDLHDSSVYTGTAGVGLLHLKMGDIAAAHAFVKNSLQQIKGGRKECTFLCGDAGPLAIAALVFNKLGAQYHSRQTECIQRILEMETAVCESKSLPNEMLYGRAGYLYTLLFLQKELGDQLIPKQTIINVSHSIISSGLSTSSDLQCPLDFIWHDKHYFGAAHGYSGIIYILLKAAMKYPEMDIDSTLTSTVDYMMSLKFPSGNYPSSFESGERDKLVHWCHGAPGFIYMFAAAYERYGSEKYKDAVLSCAELVWQRGLLIKGYGLCHGVAGNAYAFLCAYKITADPKHLHRAYQFALWCCKYGEHGCRTPDRPYSLFEGMAGTSYFLHDITNPQMAKFPAFEL